MSFRLFALCAADFRLALTALALLGLTALAGVTPGDAQAARPRRGQAPSRRDLDRIHSFNPNTEGYQPKSGLVQGPDGSLYGVTRNGGGTAR